MNKKGDSRCMLCYYHGYNAFLGITCDYILVTGKMRGCEPGKGCKRFKKGQRPRQDQIILGSAD